MDDKNDMADLRRALNVGNEQPLLDWANLRIRLADIMYCIEWHNRWWPEEERQKLGFL